MNLKITNIEVKLWVLINQRESLANNDYGVFLNIYLKYYRDVLANIGNTERVFILNHFSNNISKQKLLNDLNVTEDKYYSDLRRIIKKVWNVNHGKYQIH